MSEKEISISPTEALAQIATLQQKLESDLQWLASKHSTRSRPKIVIGQESDSYSCNCRQNKIGTHFIVENIVF